MLEKIKIDLRISHNKLDVNIQEDVDACIKDLERVGIVIPYETDLSISDALIIKAIKLYLRWQYNFENQADRYMEAYKMLRNAISLSGDYQPIEVI